MKKLSLKLDQLSVETFESDRAPGECGTVAGHMDPTFAPTCICMTDDDPTCRKPTCPSC